MIIWGGSSGFDLNTGGKYNPTTDAWIPTSTTNAPSPRDFHTAIWIGNEMIIWGGHFLDLYDYSHYYFNNGGKYNPSTDSWTAISTTNAPAAREEHTAVWTGHKMIVWGGMFFDGGSIYINTGGIYDPSNDSWALISMLNAPSARYLHTAVWTGTKMVVWGG